VNELARAWRFECAMQDRCAASRRQFDFGTALYNDELRRVYDSNFVRFERGFDQLDGAVVEACADELQPSLSHRKVVIPDEHAGARVAEDLRERGWRYFTLVTMAFGDAAAPDSARPVDEVEPAALRAARYRALDDGRRDTEARRQIVSFTELMADVGTTRLFAARGDRSEIGSFCALFREDGVAQIDEVTTVQQYRRRGLARAVVVGALRAALDSGVELVFLVADESDWPMRWYQRLGFEPVGRRYELIRV
jgi:ribosomal protein S18 acetylase RimI-like enzyme